MHDWWSPAGVMAPDKVAKTVASTSMDRAMSCYAVRI